MFKLKQLIETLQKALLEYRMRRVLNNLQKFTEQANG